MEINVTKLVELDCSRFSDSIANSGLSNIGQITWRRSCEHAKESPLVTPEQQADLRDYIGEFGAWDDDEIAAMSDTETNALLLQFIAGDVREMEHYASHDEYCKAAEDGRCSGNLYRDDDNQWFYYVGV